MAEKKPRVARKTKVSNKENPEDQIMNPISNLEDVVQSKLKAVRKPSSKRLSRSAGMGDVAVPVLAAEEEIVVESESENITISRSAVHAAEIHGSEMGSVHLGSMPQPPAVVSFPKEESDLKSVISPIIDEKDFLAPEYNSFNLKQKSKRNAFATFFIWFLDIVIILGIIILFLLYKYPTQTERFVGKIIPRFAPSTQQQSTSTDGSQAASTQQPATAPLVFRTATAVSALAQTVDSGVRTSFSGLNVQSSTDVSEVSSQNLTGDAVLYKAGAEAQAQQIATYLAQQFGLQPQLQERSSIAEDILLYLASTVTNPNLSGDVAAVYNASGKSGAAKQYCATLTNYKVSSCTSANATGAVSGLQVSYKTEAVHFTLARTSAFASATFQLAPASQTQDIVLTIGK